MTTTKFCSQSVQVIDVSSCAVSEVVSLTTLAKAGYADGYADGYAECEASVVVPDGEDYCDEDSTEWDTLAGACVSSVEESRNCLQSAYCYYIDIYFETGQPNSIVGSATEEECMGTADDVTSWFAGYSLAVVSDTACLLGCGGAADPVVCE